MRHTKDLLICASNWITRGANERWPKRDLYYRLTHNWNDGTVLDIWYSLIKCVWFARRLSTMVTTKNTSSKKHILWTVHVYWLDAPEIMPKRCSNEYVGALLSQLKANYSWINAECNYTIASKKCPNRVTSSGAEWIPRYSMKAAPELNVFYLDTKKCQINEFTQQDRTTRDQKE